MAVCKLLGETTAARARMTFNYFIGYTTYYRLNNLIHYDVIVCTESVSAVIRGLT